MKLHIVIYNGDLSIATFVFKLGEQLTKQGHQVTFMGHASQKFSFKKAEIRHYPLPQYKDTGWFFIRMILLAGQLLIQKPLTIPRIWQTLKSDYRKNLGQKGKKDWGMDFIRLAACQLLGPDLIHNQNSPALKSLEPLFDHYPVVQSLHGKLEDLSPFFNFRIAGIYKEFFPSVKGFQSDSALSWQNAQKFGAQTKNVFISYSLAEKKWLNTQKDYTKRNDPLRIISVGKFIWKKGFVYALEAMNYLKAHQNFSYKIIGGGDHTAAYFHIEDLNLQDHVQLVPNLPHNQVFKEIDQSDLFLLPSLQEGFATVVTEAMTLGTPVISTTCSGMPELLQHKVNAFLVPPRDPKSIADAVQTFANTPSSEIDKITANAQALVKERLLWEDQIHNYIHLYQKSLL